MPRLRPARLDQGLTKRLALDDQALDVYVDKHVDFIDAYHAFLLKKRGLRRIATYDRKHFRRADWLEVVEP